MVLLNSGFTSLLCIGLMFQVYFGLILEFFSGFRVLLNIGLRLKSILGSCRFSSLWEDPLVWISSMVITVKSRIFFILFQYLGYGYSKFKYYFLLRFLFYINMRPFTIFVEQIVATLVII